MPGIGLIQFGGGRDEQVSFRNSIRVRRNAPQCLIALGLELVRLAIDLAEPRREEPRVIAQGGLRRMISMAACGACASDPTRHDGATSAAASGPPTRWRLPIFAIWSWQDPLPA